MPARQVCQNFFRDVLAPFHKYRQNALLDATIALINGASLTLTSIGRYLPGTAQVKNKIKRVDRLLGNESLQRDIPLIFRNIIAMLTSQLSLCVIAVDWSGYPSQEYHVLRASLLCDGRSLPLLSWIVPSEKQQNPQIQKAFLDALAGAVNPRARVIIVTDAGFQNAWFRHIRSLGWDFIGRVRGKSRCGWTAKASAGSGVRNYRPVASQNIWGRVHLPVRNMPDVMAIFICIKKSRKAGRIVAPGAA